MLIKLENLYQTFVNCFPLSSEGSGKSKQQCKSLADIKWKLWANEPDIRKKIVIDNQAKSQVTKPKVAGWSGFGTTKSCPTAVEIPLVGMQSVSKEATASTVEIPLVGMQSVSKEATASTVEIPLVGTQSVSKEATASTVEIPLDGTQSVSKVNATATASTVETSETFQKVAKK
jgi:hypothetical protein